MTNPAPYSNYPGARFGLPADGPGALATWGRRVAALVIDWVMSLLAVQALFEGDSFGSTAAGQWGPLVVFALEAFLLTSLLGGSAGQLIMGIAIRRTSGGTIDPARALLRTLLICLVIPPVIYNRDRQGLHDLAVGSVAVRR